MADVFPLQVGGINIEDWKIRTVKSSILSSQEDEDWREALHLPELPEMVFGDARVQFVHSSGRILTFKAYDALAGVDTSAEPTKVAASETWMATASTEKAKDAVTPFDWTYATEYGGSSGRLEVPTPVLSVANPNKGAGETPSAALIVPGAGSVGVSLLPTHENDGSDNLVEEDWVFEDVAAPVPPEKSIDYELLKQREVILFFDEIIFFEDELADHGSSTYTVKLRVMPSCFFCLARQFIRVDGVYVAVNDTRIFHAFGSPYVVRKSTSMSASCPDLEAANPMITPAFYANVENVIPLLTTTRDVTSVLTLPSP